MNTTCNNCGHEFDYESIPEAGMGYVECPNCKNPVTQNKKMNMEYTNIISLVPEGEHFDASAINDGVWLSVGHVNSIESRLATDAAAIATAQDEIAAQGSAAAQAQQDLEAANATITERDATISELQAENARLKAAPAGNFSKTSKDADDLGGSANKFHTSVDEEAEKMRQMRNKK